MIEVLKRFLLFEKKSIIKLRLIFKGVLATSRNGNLLKYALIISCPSVAIILVVSVLAVYYRKRKGKVVEKLCHRKAQRQGTFLVNPTFKPAGAEHLNISIA
jgi:hypothetical protein